MWERCRVVDDAAPVRKSGQGGRRRWKGKFGRIIAGGAYALFGEKTETSAQCAPPRIRGVQKVCGRANFAGVLHSAGVKRAANML